MIQCLAISFCGFRVFLFKYLGVFFFRSHLTILRILMLKDAVLAFQLCKKASVILFNRVLGFKIFLSFITIVSYFF